ncbi:hypothetical protein LO762_18995 [Actinocorallia sp. API 0066]|uniref:hypothetical protein n=1 Tax=Actinocorallia sp. API 0066 TaxID=2896846 RepID=UPI001E329C3B|nr:hypothetical protein [Actinocorallia sp. API 0066]MCD0451268.1 hypothetical protein [Actinocorallia sp. API 0066]
MTAAPSRVVIALTARAPLLPAHLDALADTALSAAHLNPAHCPRRHESTTLILLLPPDTPLSPTIPTFLTALRATPTPLNAAVTEGATTPDLTGPAVTTALRLTATLATTPSPTPVLAALPPSLLPEAEHRTPTHHPAEPAETPSHTTEHHTAGTPVTPARPPGRNAAEAGGARSRTAGHDADETTGTNDRTAGRGRGFAARHPLTVSVIVGVAAEAIPFLVLSQLMLPDLPDYEPLPPIEMPDMSEILAGIPLPPDPTSPQNPTIPTNPPSTITPDIPPPSGLLPPPDALLPGTPATPTDAFPPSGPLSFADVLLPGGPAAPGDALPPGTPADPSDVFLLGGPVASGDVLLPGGPGVPSDGFVLGGPLTVGDVFLSEVSGDGFLTEETGGTVEGFCPGFGGFGVDRGVEGWDGAI